jgi:hypothetical protein
MVSLNIERFLPEIFLAIALSSLLIYGVTFSTTLVSVEGTDKVAVPMVQRNVNSLAILVLLRTAMRTMSLG